MTVNTDTSSFFGGSIDPAKFEAVGDKLEGVITAKTLRQQTDFDDPSIRLTWPDGRPKMEALLTIQTPYRTEDDDGLRLLYVRGYMQRAFVTAVRAAGLRDVSIGMWVSVVFSAEEPTANPDNFAKLFEVELKAPTSATARRRQLRQASGKTDQHTQPPLDDDGPPPDEPPF